MRALLLLALVASSAQAGVYKWKDANGVMHYDDSQYVNSLRMTREYMDKRRVPADPGWSGAVPSDFVEKVERDCAHAQERLANYRDAAQIFGRDPSGTVYAMSEREAALMIAGIERESVRYCQPDAARKLYREEQLRLEAAAKAPKAKTASGSKP